MGQVKQKQQPVFGQFILGSDRLQQPVPEGLSLSPSYVRNRQAQGQGIANRSPQRFYHGPGYLVPYYNARQVFTATQWDALDGLGWRAMPIVRTTPFDGTGLIALLQFDQGLSMRGFSRATMHLYGTSYDEAGTEWNAQLVAVNNESNPVFVVHGGVRDIQPASAQTIVNANNFYNGITTGAFNGIMEQFSSVDYIAFALY